MSVSTSGQTGYPIADAIRLGVLDTYNIATDVYSMYQQNKLNKWQQDFAQSQFDYQKELNALNMQREDTAVQRRAADLAAAGLNPNLAVGSAASSNVLSTSKGVPNLSAPTSRGIPFQALVDLKAQQANVDIMRSQAHLQEQQAKYYGSLAGKTESDSAYTRSRIDELIYNLDKSKELNMRTGDYGSGVVRQVVEALQFLKSDANAPISEWSKNNFDTIINKISEIVTGTDSATATDFFKSLISPPEYMKDALKSIPNNIKGSAEVLQYLWERFKLRARDHFYDAPRLYSPFGSPFLGK